MLNTYSQIGNLATFVVDIANVRRDNGHQIAWEHVSPESTPATEYTITANGGEVAGATSVTVLALPVALPIGAVLDFGEHSVNSTQMLAKVAAPAAAGATEITVLPLSEAVEDTSTATYRALTSERKAIPAGTIMAQMADGRMIPVKDGTTETAFAILIADAQEDRVADAKSGYGVIVAGIVYENLLPDYGAADFADWKTELAAAGSFQYRTWADDTAA